VPSHPVWGKISDARDYRALVRCKLNTPQSRMTLAGVTGTLACCRGVHNGWISFGEDVHSLLAGPRNCIQMSGVGSSYFSLVVPHCSDLNTHRPTTNWAAPPFDGCPMTFECGDALYSSARWRGQPHPDAFGFQVSTHCHTMGQSRIASVAVHGLTGWRVASPRSAQPYRNTGSQRSWAAGSMS